MWRENSEMFVLLTFFDLPRIRYLSPKLLRDHEICYSFIQHLHWELLPHRGVRSQERALEQVWSVTGARRLLEYVKRDCKRCRLLLAKTIDQEMADIPRHQLCIAPPFYSIVVDCMSPLKAHSAHNFRAVIHGFALVVVCAVTGAVASYVLEKEDTDAVVKAFLRHFHRYGFAKFLRYDLSSAFQNSPNIEMECRDLELKLNRLGVASQNKMVQAHHEHGRVERAIRGIRDVFAQQDVDRHKQSIISWETTLCCVSGVINNLPVARLSDATQGVREIDILTRNRLLLGRNNYRSPEGDFYVPGKPGEMLEKIKDINRDFYKKLMENLSSFIDKPKWHRGSEDVQVGDVVLFMVEEKKIASTWMLGIVEEKISTDSRPGKWRLKYQNASESHYRYTERSSRDLVIIHKISDLDYNSKSHFEAMEANNHYRAYCQTKREERKLDGSLNVQT